MKYLLLVIVFNLAIDYFITGKNLYQSHLDYCEQENEPFEMGDFAFHAFIVSLFASLIILFAFCKALFEGDTDG